MATALLVLVVLSTTAQPAGAADQGARSQEYAPDDCNGNGIPDTEDLEQGTAADVNHNGDADDCDDDPTVYDWVHNDWRSLAGARDTSYVSVYYSRGESLHVCYTVPAGRHRVTLRVKGLAPVPSVSLRDTLQGPGAYRVAWRPRRSDGSYLSQGRAELLVRIGRREYRRPLAWRWSS